MTSRSSEHSRPPHSILHLSDLHLRASGLLYDRVDGQDRLRRTLQAMVASAVRPDAVVFTGDLADRGEQVAYGMLRALVDPVVNELGADAIWLMGEHDDRAAFRTTLLGQHASTTPVHRSYFRDGLRIVTLDTTVPGQLYGDLGYDQLDWLRSELSSPAPRGTVLAMHHPPLPSATDLDASTELRHQSDLAAVLTGTDVRVILAGHLHYSTSASFAGIPVSVASSTSHTQDLQTPANESHLRDGAQSYNLVQFYEHTVMSTVVPVGDSILLNRISAGETASLLALAEVAIPPGRAPVADTALHARPVWDLTRV